MDINWFGPEYYTELRYPVLPKLGHWYVRMDRFIQMELCPEPRKFKRQGTVEWVIYDYGSIGDDIVFIISHRGKYIAIFVDKRRVTKCVEIYCGIDKYIYHDINFTRLHERSGEDPHQYIRFMDLPARTVKQAKDILKEKDYET